jgi:hypothetical protein
MKKLLTILGFTWAAICLLIVLVMFPGLDSFSRQLAKLSFMKVNPTLSGGDTARSVVYENYTLYIHQPVFEALIGESSTGFIQLDWVWNDSIPVSVSDSVDFNNDNHIDFVISIDPQSDSVLLDPLQPFVEEITNEARVENGWIVRVGLINEKKLKASR